MASGDIKLKIDNFFTDTRLYECNNRDCFHNGFHWRSSQDMNCTLKNISLDKDGKCAWYKKNN